MNLLSSLFPRPLDGAKSKNLSGVLATVFALSICYVVAPIIFQAVQGLAGLLIGGAICWAALKFAPVFGEMIGNQALKLVKWEARQNPVETMQRIYRDRQEQVEADVAMAAQFNRDVEAYRPTVALMQRDYPEDAPMFVSHLQAMLETKEMVYEGISAAKLMLAEYQRQIKRADAIWRATQTGNKLSAFAGRLGKTEAMEKIKNDEAILSIQTRMTNSFANLDDLRRKMKDKSVQSKPTTFGNGGPLLQSPAPYIEVQTVVIPESQKVMQK
jgi:hypothetical protein